MMCNFLPIFRVRQVDIHSSVTNLQILLCPSLSSLCTRRLFSNQSHPVVTELPSPRNVPKQKGHGGNISNQAIATSGFKVNSAKDPANSSKSSTALKLPQRKRTSHVHSSISKHLKAGGMLQTAQVPGAISVKSVASSSSNATTAISPAKSSNKDAESSPWSIIHASEDLKVLEQLLVQQCHIPAQLMANKYYVGCRKCIKGKSKITRGPQCNLRPGESRKPDKELGKNMNACCGREKPIEFALAPLFSPRAPKSRAIVLDCEMAQVAGGQREVVLICAADFFTGAILLKKRRSRTVML